jgi:hypothetical protein
MLESVPNLGLRHALLWVIQTIHSYKLNETIEKNFNKTPSITDVAKVW